jgi:tyrosyl-tRNA synthetase
MATMHLQLRKLGAGIERYAQRKGYAREWAWRREVTNNNTWFNKLPVSDFMRVLGSGMRMGPLLGREALVRLFTVWQRRANIYCKG